MADAFQQDVVAGALVNGQVYVNFRDGNVAKAFPHVDQVHIAGAGVLGFSGGIAVQRVAQLLVVAAGGLFGGVQLFGVHAMHGLVVILDSRTGVALGHHVADDRVGGHADARQDHQRRKAQFQSGGGIHGKNPFKTHHRGRAGTGPSPFGVWFDLFCLLKEGCQSAIALLFLGGHQHADTTDDQQSTDCAEQQSAETTGGGQLEALAVDDGLSFVA